MNSIEKGNSYPLLCSFFFEKNMSEVFLLLVSKFVDLVWGRTNKKLLVEKGYTFTHFGDKVNVSVDDLSKGCNALVELNCDYCGESLTRRYSDHISTTLITNKDACSDKDCVLSKMKETNNIKYGTDHYMKTKEGPLKLKQSMLEKYGVEHNMMLEETKEKIRKTNIERYGFEIATQNPQIKAKIIHTNNIRYGANSATNNAEIRTKQLNTNIERYGTMYPLLNEDVKQKSMNTLFSNGTAPASRQQRYICNHYNGVLNYPFRNWYFLDIAFPEEKLYIEIDLAGHDLQVFFGNISQEDFDKKERNRFFALYKRGWKLVRIISSHEKIPSDQKLTEMLEFAKNYLSTGRHYVRFYLDEGTVRTSQFETEFDFGELRWIHKNTLDEQVKMIETKNAMTNISS